MTISTEQLHEIIAAYNEAWNAHDVERIGSMHAPDILFENHTAGEQAEGDAALDYMARIFESRPRSRVRDRPSPLKSSNGRWTPKSTEPNLSRPIPRGHLLA